MSEETMDLPQNSRATETLNSEIQRHREAAKAALKGMVLLDREAMLLSEEAVRAGGLDVGWNLQQMSRKSQMAREASEKAERAREDLERASRRARARTHPIDTRQISMLEVIEGGAGPRQEEDA